METIAAGRTLTATEQPKELSKIGQWMKEHPHGLDVVITDPRILDGLSIFDILNKN